MGENIKRILFAGIPIGIVMGLITGLSGLVLPSVVIGSIMGVLAGLTINGVASYMKKKFKAKSAEIAGGKDVIMEDVANHFMRGESVGGWLCLTKDELIFMSHKYNIQNHHTVIPLKDIKEAKTSLTLGIVPNGLSIITENGVEKFVVNNRKVWSQKITEALT